MMTNVRVTLSAMTVACVLGTAPRPASADEIKVLTANLFQPGLSDGRLRSKQDIGGFHRSKNAGWTAFFFLPLFASVTSVVVLHGSSLVDDAVVVPDGSGRRARRRMPCPEGDSERFSATTRSG
jgi:hypothetical protein